MTINGTGCFDQDDYPPRADLRNMMAQQPLPTLPPGLIDPASMSDNEATTQARTILSRLNSALATNDAKALEACFYAGQAYWKDQLALTWHLRTFSNPGTIAASLLETARLRNSSMRLEFGIDEVAVFVPATPILQFIDCPLLFKTESPSALCRGKILLLPVAGDGDQLTWKIWILSTRVESLTTQSEDEGRLRSPGRSLGDLMDFETDVFIIGAGNAAVALSARLKALGVESVMADRNARPGGNWALRYDCMRFHIPTSFCKLPYMCYDKELRSPHLLTRQDLASNVRRYVESFNLNILNSAEIKWTGYYEVSKRWSITFQTAAGPRRATSKYLVMAIGIGSQKPHVPHIAEPHLYAGLSIHSVEYKSATLVKAKGAKSVIVIGTANPAFDVLVDCHMAGLDATIVARSPTYIVPLDYLQHKASLGAYDAGVDQADELFLTLPAVVDGQLARDLFTMFASNEPERYAALEAASFPVLDSRDPNCTLIHNLLERAGGHYVVVGGTKLIEEKKINFKAGVEPVSYTEGGLRFSDSSFVDADAIIWCTGFSDSNVKTTAADVLGNKPDANEFATEAQVNAVKQGHILRPRDIASRLDATWGVDEEGEVRGMWKRHPRVESFWIMGGHTQQHRWHSRTIALQIKAGLEGILPPAYRDTPTTKSAR